MSITAPLPVGLYTRVSVDRGRESQSIRQQDAECREAAERLGLRIVDVYAETVSAWKHGQARPEWERLLADAKAGRIGGVFAWALDRLARDGEQGERLVSMLRHDGVRVFTRSGETGSPLEARIFFSIAEAESDAKSARVKRSARARAAAGMANGGPRPFGHRHDPEVAGRLLVEPLEAALIREASERVLLGATLYGVAVDWRARGVQTARGRDWKAANLGAMLREPRLAGLRLVDGELRRSRSIDPVLRRAEWEALFAKLNAPGRTSAKGSARHLLTGVLRCGECGGRMSSAGGSTERGRGRTYRCNQPVIGGGCGRVSVNAAGAERVVEQAVRGVLDGVVVDPVADPDSERAALLEERAGLEQRLRGAQSARFVTGELDAAGFAHVKDMLEGRLGLLDAALHKIAASSEASSLRGAGVELWDGASVERRRGIIGALVDEVRIAASRGGGPFDPQRVRIAWRS